MKSQILADQINKENNKSRSTVFQDDISWSTLCLIALDSRISAAKNAQNL